MPREKSVCKIRLSKKDIFKNKGFDFYLKIWKLSNPDFEIERDRIVTGNSSFRKELDKIAVSINKNNPSQAILNWNHILKLFSDFQQLHTEEKTNIDKVSRELWTFLGFDPKPGFSEDSINKLCKNKLNKLGESIPVNKYLLEIACKVAEINFYEIVDIDSLSTYLKDKSFSVSKNEVQKEDNKTLNTIVTSTHLQGKILIEKNPNIAKRKFQEQLLLIYNNDPNVRFNALAHINLRISDCYFNLKDYDKSTEHVIMAEEFFNNSISSMKETEKIDVLSRKAKIAIFQVNQPEALKYLVDVDEVIKNCSNIIKIERGYKKISEVKQFYKSAFR